MIEFEKNYDPLQDECRLTEIVFILDKSGSMEGLESDSVGGFNAMLKDQENLDCPAYVSTYLFNEKSHLIHDRIDIKKCPAMKISDFRVGGSTALIDTIGHAIDHIGTIHKYARLEDLPDTTIFVIITDGLENSSYLYTSDQVKRMIEEKKSESSWEFIFLGANIDSVETAANLGINENRVSNYINDMDGIELNFRAINNLLDEFRTNCIISDDWLDDIEEDYESNR